MKVSDMLARKKISNYIENDFYLYCESLLRKYGSNLYTCKNNLSIKI